MDLLHLLMIKLNIQCYLIMDCVIKFLRRLNIISIIKNSGIENNINHNFGKVRIDSYNSLPIKKIIGF